MQVDEHVDAVFEQHNLLESHAIRVIAEALCQEHPVLLECLPMTAYLDGNLNIVYKGGRRYRSLEKAIKEYVRIYSMQ